MKDDAELVLAVARYCLDEGTLEGWEKFMAAHEDKFTRDGEHKFEYTEVHAAFVALVENRIDSYLRKNGSSLTAFYALCEGLSKSEDHFVNTFVDLILMATDYVAFVDVMSSSKRRSYFLHILRTWRRDL